MLKRVLHCLIILLVFTLYFNGIIIFANNNKLNNTTDYNILEYDCISDEVTYINFENSVWESLNNSNDIEIFEDRSITGIVGNDDRVQVSDSSVAPYRNVAKLSLGNVNNNLGTCFFIGKNVLLTAAHCTYNSNVGFIDNLLVTRGYNGPNNLNNNYTSCYVEKIYIPREYYCSINQIEGFTSGMSFLYDWAVLIIDEPNYYGSFGKIANYTNYSSNVTIAGYPGDIPYNYSGQYMYYCESTFNVDKCNNYKLEYYCDSANGMSGGPIYVNINGNYYAIGVHGASGTQSNGGVKINSFLYRFTNSLLANKGIETRDYYFERQIDDLGTYYQINYYNCVTKYIVSPKENEIIYVSTNGINFIQCPSYIMSAFYCTGSNSLEGQYDYKYFKVYDTIANSFSQIYSIDDLYSLDERSANYYTSFRTNVGITIPTQYNGNNNSWNHNSMFGHEIKGNVVYNGISKNIDVIIPPFGYNYSSITIDNVTFSLRAGMSKCSLKASVPITFDQYTSFFAFGID